MNIAVVGAGYGIRKGRERTSFLRHEQTNRKNRKNDKKKV